MIDKPGEGESEVQTSNCTSNDLWMSLASPQPEHALLYRTVVQTAADVQDIQNSPSISMGPYLIRTGQTKLLTRISVYSERGSSPTQVRLLYMNALALCVWKAMDKHPRIVGAQKRPPRTALLTFGVPFSN
jgi:hypothetical protein